MEFNPLCTIFPEMGGDELSSLANDIAEHGLKDPIELDGQGRIVDGRNRYLACMQAGVEPTLVRCTVPDEQLSQYVISKNILRRHLTYDQRVGMAMRLQPVLSKQAKERQGTRTDLDPKSDQCYGRSAEQAASQCDVGKTQVNEMIAAEKNDPEIADKLLSGDATVKDVRKQERKRKQAKKEEEALSKIDPVKKKWVLTKDQSVVQCDVLITDPPYGILTEEWEPGAGGIEDVTRLWATRWSTCGADFIISFFSQRFMWRGKQWFDESLLPYQFQQLLIWHYPNNKGPQSRMGFKQTWEPVFFYRRRDSEREIEVSGTDWGNSLNDFDCHVAATPQTNFNDVDSKVHPAQKPLSVMRWLVNAATRPGDTVCDPFCGSGTTGVASVGLNRNFHGIEESDEYMELAEKRIAAYA